MVKHPSLDFGSDHDLRIVRLSPMLGMECADGSLSLSLSLSVLVSVPPSKIK